MKYTEEFITDVRAALNCSREEAIKQINEMRREYEETMDIFSA